jgi:hypothetical protein
LIAFFIFVFLFCIVGIFSFSDSDKYDLEQGLGPSAGNFTDDPTSGGYSDGSDTPMETDWQAWTRKTLFPKTKYWQYDTMEM